MSDTMPPETAYTPRELVSELDRYIIGQGAAKKAVAIALRDRWRRQQVPEPLRDDILPRNIILIGPTGVGKTEIARRLAKLVKAPFVKVEASKFTEVGYVGRDVEGIIRDLAEVSVNLVREEERKRIQVRAEQLAEERVLDLLLPAPPSKSSTTTATFEEGEADEGGEPASRERTREWLRKKLRKGELDDRKVEIETTSAKFPAFEIFSSSGMEEMDIQIKDMFGSMFPKQTKRRKVTVQEALALLVDQEAEKLIDMDTVTRSAIERLEQSGIVFLDELDKIAGREAGGGHGPDVSREGVQRDILPIVEGSTVNTKYGTIRTDHVLFIAAGAFHVSKVSDLIPELQGRFPIRVELEALTKDDFRRILTEPDNSLIKQYTAMLETEEIELTFESDAIDEIAALADLVNQRNQNIGARRLVTVLERLLEDISFRAPEMNEKQVTIDRKMVRDRLDSVVQDEDLSRYIL